MGKVVYTSKSTIERKRGPLRIAHLPGEAQPVVYSVHGAIAEHYKVDPAKLSESHAATIDYVISATAGWMLGTFGGALEARQIDASDGKLTADVTGEVELEEGVLVIRRVHVSMRLVAPEDLKEKVERAHALYAMSCPLYRTLHNAIRLTSSVELVRASASWFQRSACVKRIFISQFDVVNRIRPEGDETWALSGLERYVKPRRQIQRRIIEDAIASCELKSTTDPELLIDALNGPLFFRWLQGHAPLNKGFAKGILERVIPAFQPHWLSCGTFRAESAPSNSAISAKQGSSWIVGHREVGVRRFPANGDSPECDAFSKDLKHHGFSFVGATVLYAHMQAVGTVSPCRLFLLRRDAAGIRSCRKERPLPAWIIAVQRRSDVILDGGRLQKLR